MNYPKLITSSFFASLAVFLLSTEEPQPVAVACEYNCVTLVDYELVDACTPSTANQIVACMDSCQPISFPAGVCLPAQQPANFEL